MLFLLSVPNHLPFKTNKLQWIDPRSVRKGRRRRLDAQGNMLMYGTHPGVFQRWDLLSNRRNGAKSPSPAIGTSEPGGSFMEQVDCVPTALCCGDKG